MRKLFKVLVLLFGAFFLLSVTAVSFIVGAGFLLESIEPEPDSFSHRVQYSVEINTNGSLENSTLVLPYPDSERFREEIRGNASNVSIQNELNASLSLVERNGRGMLKLDIGEFDPETMDERFEEEENLSIEHSREVKKVERPENLSDIHRYSTYRLVVTSKYNRSLNTTHGLYREPHLEANRTRVAENCDSFPHIKCFNSTTRAYLDYNTGEDTYLELSISLDGRNSWFAMGWSGNSYRQDFYTGYYEEPYLVGPQKRWFKLEGREVQGEGSYR